MFQQPPPTFTLLTRDQSKKSLDRTCTRVPFSSLRSLSRSGHRSPETFEDERSVDDCRITGSYCNGSDSISPFHKVSIHRFPHPRPSPLLPSTKTLNGKSLSILYMVVKYLYILPSRPFRGTLQLLFRYVGPSTFFLKDPSYYRGVSNLRPVPRVVFLVPSVHNIRYPSVGFVLPYFITGDYNVLTCLTPLPPLPSTTYSDSPIHERLQASTFCSTR